MRHERGRAKSGKGKIAAADYQRQNDHLVSLSHNMVERRWNSGKPVLEDETDVVGYGFSFTWFLSLPLISISICLTLLLLLLLFLFSPSFTISVYIFFFFQSFSFLFITSFLVFIQNLTFTLLPL